MTSDRGREIESKAPARSLARALAFVVSALVASGCASVKPHEKELLADPAMIYGSGKTVDRHEQHVLDSRAAASSASSSGGGCGCN